MATAAAKPKLFSYEYFLAKKGDPKTELAYYFYVLCYKIGLQTVSLFQRVVAFVSEITVFLFDRLILRPVHLLVRKAKYAAAAFIRGYVRSEKEWYEPRILALRDYRLARHELRERMRGSGPAANQLAPVLAEHDLRIRKLSSQINGRRLGQIFQVSAPVIALACLIVTLSVWGSYSSALAVEYNGRQLGYIKNERVYDAAVENIEDLVIGVDSRYNLEATPFYTLKYVKNAQIYDETAFTNVFLSAVLGDEVQQACGLYINGKFLFAIENEAQLKEYMQSLLQPFVTSRADAVVDFYDTVEYLTGMYPITQVKTYGEATKILGSVSTATVKYTCVKNDTLQSVADKNGISVDTLLNYNPEIESKIVKNKSISIVIPQPFLPVQTAVRTVYNESIPFDTVVKYSSSKYESYSEITTTGRDGTQSVTADIIYVNGVEVSREVISTTVTKSPRTQIKTIGTKPVPKYAPSIDDYKGVRVTGKFLWPVNGGYISCGWLGYKGHYGLDIAAARGTNIYAADGGVVVYTRKAYTSYGFQILIDHGNGFCTRYAHCSKLLVSVGDKVQKGDVIAYVGSTGNSSGNHLHFEVIIDGQRVNPRPYITGK